MQNPFVDKRIGELERHGDMLTLMVDSETCWSYRPQKPFYLKLHYDPTLGLTQKPMVCKEEITAFAFEVQAAHPFKEPLALTCGVSMGEYAITTGVDPRPILGTVGAVTCLALAVYDTLGKRAFLAHIHCKNDLSFLKNRLKEIFNTVCTRYCLVGGTMDIPSFSLVDKVKTMLSDLGIKAMQSGVDRLLTASMRSPASLLIDARDGGICFHIRPSQLQRIGDKPWMSGGAEPVEIECVYDAVAAEEAYFNTKFYEACQKSITNTEQQFPLPQSGGAAKGVF